jgi:hypothetical protein
MTYWIFKIIYYPIFIMVISVALYIVASLMFECTWIVPYRWFVIIGIIAYIADLFVNGEK